MQENKKGIKRTKEFRLEPHKIGLNCARIDFKSKVV